VGRVRGTGRAAALHARSFLSLETPWDYAKLSVAFIALMVLAMALFVLWPAEKEVRVRAQAEPLRKNAALNLSPGEVYAYNYSLAGGSALVSFEVGNRFGNCVIVRSSPGGMEGCIAGNGTLLYGNLPRGFFEEWMLALAENWSWEVREEREIAWLGLSETQLTRYVVTEVGERKGRRAFHVVVSVSYISSNATFQESEAWVDAEKRVLMELDSGALKIELIQAPFPIG